MFTLEIVQAQIQLEGDERQVTYRLAKVDPSDKQRYPGGEFIVSKGDAETLDLVDQLMNRLAAIASESKKSTVTLAKPLNGVDDNTRDETVAAAREE